MNSRADSLRFARELLFVPNSSTPADRSEDKHRLRKHVILDVIRERGSLSRADISKITGFNLRTTTITVEELLRENLLIEHAAVETRRGRRPTPLSLNERAAMVMGIDIGRQRSVGRLMDLGANLIREVELQTPSIAKPNGFSEWAALIARATVREASGSLPPLSGIGVGIPSVMERGGTNCLFDKEKVAQSVVDELQQDYDVEVLVDTDARMMALGSLWFGVGRKLSNFAVLKLGVSLGLGIVLNDSLVKAAFGRDMEFGHTPMGDPEADCYCGATGCLDTVTCGWGIERMAREAGIKKTAVADIADLAREGDAAALAVFDRFARGLGRAIAAVINLYSVEAVVVSGRIIRAADLYFDAAKGAAARHALPKRFRETEIILSDPNARLAALGTAAIIYSHIFHSHHVAVREVI